jgi:hypothetical protein
MQFVLHTEAKRGVIGEFIASITLFFPFMLLFWKNIVFLRQKWAKSG